MCSVRGCENEPLYNICHVEYRKIVEENAYCEEHAKNVITEFRNSKVIGKGIAHSIPGAICVEFELIGDYLSQYYENHAFVYLHEVGGSRRFCTNINRATWWSFVYQMKHEERLLPTTPFAWADSIKGLGGRIQNVLIDKADKTSKSFESIISIEQHGSILEIDVLPRDAYILALIFNAPIFIMEEALKSIIEIENQ